MRQVRVGARQAHGLERVHFLGQVAGGQIVLD